MERVKEASGDITNGFWGEKLPRSEEMLTASNKDGETSIVDPRVHRTITLMELKAHSRWCLYADRKQWKGWLSMRR